MAWVAATWNVNSIRSRLPVLLPWLASAEPDIVCLQETKVEDGQFPLDAIEDAGYHAATRGEGGYNGVAILSKTPIEEIRCGFDDGQPADEARLIVGIIGGVPIVNTYVPQGRSVDHEMFGYKLEWFDRLRTYFTSHFSPDEPLLWAGDLNVAPKPIDVWEPERHLGHVCFNPQVTDALESVRAWGLVDLFRRHVPDSGQYTYYDYRTKDGVAEGKGWRVDHLHGTAPLAERSVEAWIDVAPRWGDRPSDHAPLLVRFDG